MWKKMNPSPFLTFRPRIYESNLCDSANFACTHLAEFHSFVSRILTIQFLGRNFYSVRLPCGQILRAFNAPSGRFSLVAAAPLTSSDSDGKKDAGRSLGANAAALFSEGRRGIFGSGQKEPGNNNTTLLLLTQRATPRSLSRCSLLEVTPAKPSQAEVVGLFV
jgi:hypothetical protein